MGVLRTQKLGAPIEKGRRKGTLTRPCTCSLSPTRIAVALRETMLARVPVFLLVGADVLRPRASRSAPLNILIFIDFVSTADVFRVLQGNFCFSKDLENYQEKITFPLAPSVCPRKHRQRRQHRGTGTARRAAQKHAEIAPRASVRYRPRRSGGCAWKGSACHTPTKASTIWTRCCRRCRRTRCR